MFAAASPSVVRSAGASTTAASDQGAPTVTVDFLLGQAQY